MQKANIYGGFFSSHSKIIFVLSACFSLVFGGIFYTSEILAATTNSASAPSTQTGAPQGNGATIPQTRGSSASAGTGAAGSPPQQPPAPNSSGTKINPATAKAFQGELTASPEITAELKNLNVKKQLDLPNYNPTFLPVGFFGNIGYYFKDGYRNFQESAYAVFASKASTAELYTLHANERFIDATTVLNNDPKATDKFARLVGDYNATLAKVGQIAPQVRAEDPKAAKALQEKLVQQQMFTIPKVMNTIQDAVAINNPAALPQVLQAKESTIKTAGVTVVRTATDPTDLAKTINTVADKTATTAFSPVNQAQITAEFKKNIINDITVDAQKAFDQVVSAQIAKLQNNLNASNATPDEKGKALAKYMEQMPGKNMVTFEIANQIRSQAVLPNEVLDKIQEVKNRIAQDMAELIKLQASAGQQAQETVKQAIFNTKRPELNDVKAITEISGMIPDKNMREQMVAARDQQVKAFLSKFNDANAVKVTAEFKALTDEKLKSGAIAPDPAFFAALDALKAKLSPEQQQFINGMQDTGKQVFLDRAVSDDNFAKRVATANQGDFKFFDQFKQNLAQQPDALSKIQAPAGTPPGTPPPNIDQIFQKIGQQQVQNFQQFLSNVNSPEAVKQMQQRFLNEVPADIKQQIEQQFKFDPSAEFQKAQQVAAEKQQFFQQQFQQMQQQYQQKFGTSAPLPPPGQTSFQLFNPALVPPPGAPASGAPTFVPGFGGPPPSGFTPPFPFKDGSARPTGQEEPSQFLLPPTPDKGNGSFPTFPPGTPPTPGRFPNTTFPPGAFPSEFNPSSGSLPPGLNPSTGAFPPGTFPATGTFPPGTFPPGFNQPPGSFPPGFNPPPGSFPPGGFPGNTFKPGQIPQTPPTPPTTKTYTTPPPSSTPPTGSQPPSPATQPPSSYSTPHTPPPPGSIPPGSTTPSYTTPPGSQPPTSTTPYGTPPPSTGTQPPPTGTQPRSSPPPSYSTPPSYSSPPSYASPPSYSSPPTR